MLSFRQSTLWCVVAWAWTRLTCYWFPFANWVACRVPFNLDQAVVLPRKIHAQLTFLSVSMHTLDFESDVTCSIHILPACVTNTCSNKHRNSNLSFGYCIYVLWIIFVYTVSCKSCETKVRLSSELTVFHNYMCLQFLQCFHFGTLLNSVLIFRRTPASFRSLSALSCL